MTALLEYFNFKVSTKVLKQSMHKGFILLTFYYYTTIPHLRVSLQLNY